MNTIRNRLACAITSILACSLLAACGGGGGGMVRSSPPPVSPPPAAPPPPPPPAPATPCPMPLTADCVVEARHDILTFTEFGMSGGRQSDHKLFVHGGTLGGGYVNLQGGEYRFGGGTEIAGTTLVVWDTLVSDVRILRDYTGLGFIGESELWLWGSVRGNVHNEQRLNLRCWSGLHGCSSIPQQRIDGNYTQLAGAALETVLGRHLVVTGTATLDGSLVLAKGDASYVLPASPSSVLVLHADGGVLGTFANWISSGLFIEGSLRYGSNDVWFDLTRISLQAAMAGQGVGGITLASAGNLDRALVAADGFAGNPGVAQQQFLASAGRLLWMRDPLQAQRALDTLSGLPQTQALDAALQEAGMSPVLSAHLDRRARTQAAGAWSHTGVAGMHSGVDLWLGPQLLAGVHATHGHRAQADPQLDASTQRDERRAGAYLRWFGKDGWYAGADAGYAQRTMLLDRSIDFGAAGRWNAHSRRTMDVASLGGEAGRRLPFAGGRLTPFLRLDAAAIHGARAIEQGGSGFELALDPVAQRRLGADAGLRYARDWRHANGVWLQLQAGAGVRETLWQGGDAQRAAFIGAAGVWFDLPGVSPGRSSWLDLGLHGGFGRDWHWAMQGMRSSDRRQDAWQLRLVRNF